MGTMRCSLAHRRPVRAWGTAEQAVSCPQQPMEGGDFDGQEGPEAGPYRAPAKVVLRLRLWVRIAPSADSGVPSQPGG